MASSCLHQMVVLVVCVLAIAATCLPSCEGSKGCGRCGKLQVPYPLSTSDSCGHPLYRITCNDKKQLQVNALSGNYTVESVDPLSRSMLIATAPFIGDSCVTQDSIRAHNFSFFPGSPLFIAPGNTILLLNATEVLLSYSPLQCLPGGPCSRALSSVPQKSCRNLLCCSFVTDGRFFRYGFPVFGQETGYVSLLDLLDPSMANLDVQRVRFGMRLNWDVPAEPPCETTQEQCDANSTCVKLPAPSMSQGGVPPGAPGPPSSPRRICACNLGYLWDPTLGTCLKAPFCVRNSGSIECHKTQYAIGLTFGITGLIALVALTVYACRGHRQAQTAHAKLVKERSMILATNNGGNFARLVNNKELMKRATNNFARDIVLGCGGFGEVYKGLLNDKTVAVAIKTAEIVQNKVIPKLAVKEFSFQEINNATNNFDTPLGQGGFGSVYKGCLQDGRFVAIKVASNFSHQGPREFLNEVDLLSRIHHKNLVALLGFCNAERLVLVYEFMPNGSLDDCLHGPYSRVSPLPWCTRLRILVDAAQGIDYLHNGCNPPIIHRDVKSSNILLNDKMEAKISDFGISRDYIRDETGALPTTVMGSRGYMDPEYVSSMNLTQKVDIYSFGVLLFEVVCGRKAILKDPSHQQMNIVEWAKDLIDNGVIDDIVDVSLYGQYNPLSVRKVVEVGLACVEIPSSKRPKIGEIYLELTEAERMELGSDERNTIDQTPVDLTIDANSDISCDTEVSAR